VPPNGYGACPLDAARASLRKARKRHGVREEGSESALEWRLDRSRFRGLHTDGQELIRGWIDKAVKAQSHNKFEAFIYAWIGLNGWASCCCRFEVDRVLVNLMILDDGLTENFNRLTVDGPDRQAAEEFAHLWPIFKVADLRDLPNVTRRNRPQRTGRAAVVQYYQEHWPTADRAPNCHLEHAAGLKPDWAHTLEALYRVRNNLFHGQKSGAGREDKEIVDAAADILIPVARSVVTQRGGFAS
jgi:hypothetical protein